MDCEQFDQIVMDLLYNELADTEQAAARRHLDRCNRCAAALANLRTARNLATLPLVDPPAPIHDRLIDAARRSQREVAWPRRLGRWISWAGSYAMKPQVAMAALLVLMIGCSLLLLRGRPGSAQLGMVRVTEQGVPERERSDTLPSPSPQQLSPAPSQERQTQLEGDVDELAGNGAPHSSFEPLPSSPPPELAAFPPSEALPPADQLNLNNQLQQLVQPPSNAPGSDPYAEAMTLYKAKDFAAAARAFDGIAAASGPNSASAALHAALSVRASAGCATALPRLDSVSARFPGSNAAVLARWETAACWRILGQFHRARTVLEELAKLEGQRGRAERELARITPPKAARQQTRTEMNKAAKPPRASIDTGY